jgi:hypothetical protein
MAPRYVYSVNELIAMRGLTLRDENSPSRPTSLLGSYLAIFRQALEVCNTPLKRSELRAQSKLVFRYDENIPNRKFRKSHIMKYGTTAGLKDLPREPTYVLDVASFRLAHQKRVRTLFKSLDKLRPRVTAEMRRLAAKVPVSPPSEARLGASVGSPNPPPDPSLGLDARVSSADVAKYMVPQRRPAVRLGPGGAAFMRRRLNLRLERRKLARVVAEQDDGSAYISIYGGRTFTIKDPPPRREWRKYWYFFRKRGEWKISEHHPYGDEDEYMSLTLLDNRR